MTDSINPVQVGDIVALKKAHPCGVNRWEVARVGADIRLRCTGCDRVVALDRFEFRHRYRSHLDPAES